MRPMIVNRLRNGDLSAPPDRVLLIAGYDYPLPSWLCVAALVDRFASVAGWCLITALFTCTLPAGVVGGFFLAALAVSR